MDSLIAQHDDSWSLVLIDDASPLPEAHDTFADVRRLLGSRVTLISRARNSGQGLCRNIGARWAWRQGIPLCLYLDDDDLADPGRVGEVRRLFQEDRRAAFIYSSFDLIDETGRPVPRCRSTPSIREILDSHDNRPPVGRHAWQEVATERGYTTLTSTVSVRTWLAVAYPFPDVYVSEDQHAWLRMMAATDGVVFDDTTRGTYRVTTDGSGSSVRCRIGEGYYEQKAWVDTHGLIAAIRIALARGTLDSKDIAPLLATSYRRSALTLAGEGRLRSAEEYQALARRVLSLPPELALARLPTRPPLFEPADVR